MARRYRSETTVFCLCQRRADDLLDQLRPGRHVEQHLAAAIDPQVLAVEQKLAHRLAERGAPRVAAGHHLAALIAEPLAKQGRLCALAGAVAAVDGEEHGEKGSGVQEFRS